MFPSALNALPATPVVTSHAATIFAFDVALLDDAADASDVARLDALDAAIATLALCPLCGSARRASVGASRAAIQLVSGETAHRQRAGRALTLVGGVSDVGWIAGAIGRAFHTGPLTLLEKGCCSRSNVS
ncbi:hypothetical protein GGG16DRAFT_119492 [Schizophyllum commune]